MALNRSDIKRLRGDLSPFLIHLTRGGTYRRWKDIHNIPKDDNPTLNAKTSLEEIIQNSKIEARSPFGYFNYSVPYNGKNLDSQVKRSWLQSVCFTETPVDHIHIQFQNIVGRRLQFQPYGLAFFENSIRSKNGSPVMYFDTNNKSTRQSLDTVPTSDNCASMKSLLPLYEGFGPPLFQTQWSPKEIDFRWEREWRIVGDFNYSLENDIAFGICPANEIGHFENLVGNKFPFIDPTPPIQTMKQKLKLNPKLQNLI